MAKRLLTDFKQLKSKKLKPNSEDTSDVNMDETELSEVGAQVSMESLIDERKEVTSKLNTIWKLDSNDKIVAATTNLFKEYIETNQNKLASLFYELACFMSARSLELDNKLVAQISWLLCLQIDSMPIQILLDTADVFLQQVKNEQPLHEMMVNFFVEVFKYVQKSLQSSEGENKKKTSIDQEDIVHEKIGFLFEMKWNTKTAINILELMKNITISENEVKLLLSYLFDTNKISWSHQEITNLIDSVLKINIGKSNRALVFEAIMGFFGNLINGEWTNATSNTQRQDYIDVQKSCLIRIINNIRMEDVKNTKNFFKNLKAKLDLDFAELLQPFTFALLFSLINTSHREASLDLLHQIVTRVFDIYILISKLTWLQKCFSTSEAPNENCAEQLVQYLSHLRPSKYRLFGHEPVLSGLIVYIFDLIDSYGVHFTKATCPATLREYITKYAHDLLRELFRCVPSSRETVLNNMTKRILSSKMEKCIVVIDQLSMLVLSESAGCFQEYFSKFRNRLDHMIFIIPDVALEFLNAIKPLLKYDSIYKDNLIVKLKNSIYQNDLKIRKVGLIGLINLLNNVKLANFLPASQASQTMTLSQSQTQITQSRLSQEKTTEKNCLEIFQSLRRCLSQQSEIRSKLYQSCSSMIGQNPTLIGPVLNLLLTNLENYLITGGTDTQRVIIDFGKCCRIGNASVDASSSTRLELHEPIDVLMHALHLCMEKYAHMDQTRLQDLIDDDVKKHVDKCADYLDRLRDNIMHGIEKNLLETYRAQVMLVLAKSTANTANKRGGGEVLLVGKTQQISTQARSATQVQPQQQQVDEFAQLASFYQAFLGSIEVLIEHYFKQGSFRNVKELHKKFHELHSMITKIYSSDKSISSTTGQQKKKGASSKSTQAAPKKALSTTTSTQRTQAVTGDATTSEHANAKTQQPRKKPSIGQFNYIYRLSYSCTLGFLEIYFGKESKTDIKVKFEAGEESLVDEMRNDKIFKDYLLNVLSQQLDELLAEASQAKTKTRAWSKVYDCEAFDDKRLFEYLNHIWIMFWQEASSSSCSRPTGLTCTDAYCEDCLQKRTTYMKILSQIWKIVSLRFNLKLNDLFSFSAFDADITRNLSLDQSNMSTIAVGILDQCRLIVRRCVNWDKIDANRRALATAAAAVAVADPSSAFRVRSMKLGAFVLEFMCDIMTMPNTKLNSDDVNVLFSWCQSLFSMKSNNDPAFLKALMKYFMLICYSKNAPATLLKYVCNYLSSIANSDLNETSTNPSSANNDCFSSITMENFTAIIPILYDEFVSIIDSFGLAILKQNSTSNNSHLKMLRMVVESLADLVEVELATHAITGVLIKMFVKFYNYMIRFCKEMSSKTKTFEMKEFVNLINLIDVMGEKLHRSFNEFTRIVQNSKQSVTTSKKTKQPGHDKAHEAELARNSKLSKFTKSMPNLVYLCQQYEQSLQALNVHLNSHLAIEFKMEVEKQIHGVLDLTRKYQAFLRDFKIDTANVDKALKLTTAAAARNDGEHSSDNEEITVMKKEDEEEEADETGDGNDDDETEDSEE